MGAPKKGNLFLLKEGDGASPEVFTTIAALNATGMSVAGAAITVTDKDSAGGWRELLTGGGEKTLSINGDGIYETGETKQKNLRARAFDGSLNNYQLVDGEEVIEAAFQITTFGVTGNLNDKQMFSFTLESSGQPTVAAV